MCRIEIYDAVSSPIGSIEEVSQQLLRGVYSKLKVYEIGFIILAFCLPALPCQIIEKQNTNKPNNIKKQSIVRQKLFGINLTPKTRALLALVEKQYNKQVHEEEASNWESTKFAISDVTNDGTPLIRINASTGRKETIIVHELLHLKLRAEGWPIIQWMLPQNDLTTGNEEYLRFIESHLWDPITHQVFIPELRSMGMNEGSDLKPAIEEIVLTKRFKTQNNSLYRSLFFLRSLLEVKETSLNSQLEQWYLANGWNDSVEIAKRFKKIIVEASPYSKDRMPNILLECLDSIPSPKPNFELIGIENNHRGNLVQRVALIQVSTKN